MTDDNDPRWVHDCAVCGMTLTNDQGEQCAQHKPSPDELARRQRVVAAIGAFLAKPAKPPSRRWRGR
jgi:hypothetical protein